MATKHDILDLVELTVHDLCQHKPVPNIRLNGDTVIIGSEPLPVADIRTCIHSTKRFVDLIRGVL